jgi:phosphoglycerate dehydrogenase-like enzyme
MSWKVAITVTGIAEVGEKAVRVLEQAGCKLTHAPSSGPFEGDALLNLLDGCDAVLATTDRYSASVLGSPKLERLKIVSRWGVGYDSIDVSAATERGIIIAYTPGLTDEAVADFTFALLLGMVRRVAEGHQSMREGLWLRAWGHDLAGKTLGILGFGRIGQAVARRARGFGLQLIACDRRPRPEAVASGVRLVSFDELLAQSDYLSLHAPMVPENRGLIGEQALRKMKPTAFLVNTARGPLVDEAALLRALREGWIAGAALDVYSEEPLPPRHPFRSMPNLLLSPHQASSSRETGERVSLAAAEAIIDLMQGRKPKLVLNPEVFASPALRARALNTRA